MPVLTLGAEEKQCLAEIVVHGTRLQCSLLEYRCAIGRGGVKLRKTEGDKATPAGRFPLRRVLFRADRLAGVTSGLPVEAMAPSDGWCDDVADEHYNQRVRRPFPARHEALWRDDGLYDVIIVIGYNDAPAVRGLGSAIFMHVAAPGYTATDGCIALALPDLLQVTRFCGPETTLVIA